MTASRRLAPLPLLLIALLALVLGAGLLWSTPAEAQTTHNLVLNTNQGSGDTVFTGGNDHAQLFRTGGGDTYTLTRVIVFSDDSEGDDFDIEICGVDTTDDEFPTADCTALTAPASFTSGELLFSHSGLALSADTNYVVVFKQKGTGSVRLGTTTSGGEDSEGLTGWSIKDKYYSHDGTDWAIKSGADEALRIYVSGPRTPNQDATGRPVIYPSAEGAGILFADPSRIADPNGVLVYSSQDTKYVPRYDWSYQWIRVDGMTETNVGDGTARYQPVDDDIGKLIKVEVSYTDQDNYAETVTSLPYGPITRAPATSLPLSTLVGNTGQSPSATAMITQHYAMGFTLGDHGQGYEISSVSIDLTAAPSSLTVSLWVGVPPDNTWDGAAAYRLFDFTSPASFQAGLNTFTAPAGAFAYQNVQYFIVLSGFGASLSINETTSDAEDAGGETGAILFDDAQVRASTSTGPWREQTQPDDLTVVVVPAPTTRTTGVDPNTQTPVLRLAVEGSRRASGVLASNYAQPGGAQEIVSLSDEGGLPITLGAADRYLIRGFSWISDNTTPRSGGLHTPFDLRSGWTLTGLQKIDDAGTKWFGLAPTRYETAGINVWTAPQGATVPGSESYMAYEKYEERPVGIVLSRFHGTASDNDDRPTAPGATLSDAVGDLNGRPLMAFLGDPLYAMVQNLGQTDTGYRSVGGGTRKVLSQGFTTGPDAGRYALRGIGVDIEGSGGNVPDSALSVSVAVYSADPVGKPGAKLFDLVSPTDYAPGHSFFEAPAGTTLEADTSYVMVWEHLGGTVHRIQKATTDNEDSGAASGFSIANVLYQGADVDNLAVDGDVLMIAVYTDQDFTPPGRVTGFDLHSSNSGPRGVWGDDDTFWVANDGSADANKLYAYNRSDGSRDTSADFDTLRNAMNGDPRGICSDGTTMFVADHNDNKVYAYKMSDTTRDSAKDVSLVTANGNPQGLSCDGSHLWVAEDNDDLTSKIFVYQRSDGNHASTLDIGASILSPSSTVGAINNNDQRGMWSNGTTLFVVDGGDAQVYGYQLSDRTRDDDKNLSLDAANTNPWGLWFDGRVLWVVDTADDQVYVYDLPGAQPDNTPAVGAPTITGAPLLSATLTVKDLGSNFLGCDTAETNKRCVPGELLTDRRFSYDSRTYQIDSIDLKAGLFRLETDQSSVSAGAALADLTLHVGAVSLPFADATYAAGRFSWTSTGLSWSEDDMVELVISVPAPSPGETLTADTSGITDDTDGLDNVFYHYQWIRDDGTDVTDLDGETGPTYTTTADDVDKDIQVRVVFDDDLQNREYPRYSPQVTVLGSPPEVTSVALTSMPGSDSTYAIDDAVTATVTFDKAVDVTAGPQITLLIGTAEKAASCAAATNTTTMACSYTVVANDTANGGVAVKANTLVLNSGTIYATGATTNSATLTHSALALQSGHKVDGVRPQMIGAGNDGPRSSTDGTKILLTFDENVSNVDRTKIKVMEGTATLSTTAASATDEVVTVTLASALLSTSGTIDVELDADAVTDLPGNGNLAVGSTLVTVNLQATPLAPTDLTATAAPDETPQLAVALTWTAPASDGGSAITSHRYRYSRNSGSLGSWTTIDDSAADGANATSFTVKGLDPTGNFLTFAFEVQAVNANGNGDESDQVSVVISVPSLPPTLTVVPGDGQIEVSWVTPDNGGSAILRYQYWVFNEDTDSHVVNVNTNVPNSDADTTSFTVTGLANGVSYEVAVAAVNSVARGGYASEQNVVPATFPTAPRNLTAETGDTQVTLEWAAPTFDGGVAIDGYEYQQRTGSGAYGSWTDISGADEDTTEHTVTGLTNGTSYSFKVRAKNPVGGEGPASNEATAVPVTVPSAPQSFTATALNAKVRLEWAAPASDGGNPIVGYEYRYRAGSGSFTEWADVPGSNVNTTSYTVTGLINGTVHTFEVRARTSTLKGAAASADATPMAVAPDAPLVTVESRNTALRVTWNVADNGGSDIFRYQVQWKSGAQSFANTRQQDFITDRHTTITGLTNDTEYDVRVRARNTIGWSDWSTVKSGTPRPKPAPTVAVTADVTEPVTGPFRVTFTFTDTNLAGDEFYDVVGFEADEIIAWYTSRGHASYEFLITDFREETPGRVYSALVDKIIDGKLWIEVEADSAQSSHDGQGNTLAYETWQVDAPDPEPAEEGSAIWSDTLTVGGQYPDGYGLDGYDTGTLGYFKGWSPASTNDVAYGALTDNSFSFAGSREVLELSYTPGWRVVRLRLCPRPMFAPRTFELRLGDDKWLVFHGPNMRQWDFGRISDGVRQQCREYNWGPVILNWQYGQQITVRITR